MMIPVFSSVASPQKSNGVRMNIERMSIEGAPIPKAIPASSEFFLLGLVCLSFKKYQEW